MKQTTWIWIVVGVVILYFVVKAKPASAAAPDRSRVGSARDPRVLMGR